MKITVDKITAFAYSDIKDNDKMQGTERVHGETQTEKSASG